MGPNETTSPYRAPDSSPTGGVGAEELSVWTYTWLGPGYVGLCDDSVNWSGVGHMEGISTCPNTFYVKKVGVDIAYSGRISASFIQVPQLALFEGRLEDTCGHTRGPGVASEFVDSATVTARRLCDRWLTDVSGFC